MTMLTHLLHIVKPIMRTFLNEDVFFINQKIASRINQIINNVDNSLLYKLDP